MHGIDRIVGQYFAALTNMRSVGVMGDERTYDYAVASPRCEHNRLHDRRVLRNPIRGTPKGNEPNHKRGERGQPRNVRSDQQATWNDRV